MISMKPQRYSCNKINSVSGMKILKSDVKQLGIHYTGYNRTYLVTVKWWIVSDKNNCMSI